MNTTQIWKPIPGYEGVYSVSNEGFVRLDTKRHNKQSGELIAICLDRDGYRMTQLSPDGLSKRSARIARLVAAAFIHPIPPKMQVNHKNGIRADDRLENLEIVTCKENVRHSIEVLGHNRNGENNPAAKLSKDLVLKIRVSRANGESLTALAKRYKISDVQIRNIVAGKIWKDVGGPLTKSRQMIRTPQEVIARCGKKTAGLAYAQFKSGVGQRELSIRFEVSRTTIRNWIAKESKN